MTDHTLNRLEPLSYPLPHYAEHSQVWHARRFATWLLRAGAEPRLGTLLSSGTQAEARWRLLLEEQGVEVIKVHSDLARPLPRLLTEHRGDHFNRRLFLITGLDAVSAERSTDEIRSFWETLEGQRSQLKQTATWVTLYITQAQTLRDAIQYAPKLMREIDRVCWIWVSQERSTLTESVELPEVRHQLVYRSFIAATSAESSKDMLTLGRIFRSGYMIPSRGASAQWKWAYRLWRGEVRDPTAARFGQLGVTEVLDSSITPDDALWALLNRNEAATPARRQQWLDRANDSQEAWRINAQSPLPLLTESSNVRAQSSLIEHLRQWAEGAETPPLTHIELLEAERVLSELSAERCSLRVIATEWMTKAYAQAEDLEGCFRVNRSISEDIAIWPEGRFCAHERLLDLALFIKDFAEARRQVEALERLDLLIHSPLFEARYLEAKSKQIGALDPVKGEGIAVIAGQLAERFGAHQKQT